MTKWSANDKKYAPRQCLKHLQYNIDKWIGQQPIMFPVIHKRAFVVSTCCARIRPCLSEAQLFKEALRDFSSSLILESRFLDFLLKKYTIIDQNSKNYKKESSAHTHTKKKRPTKRKVIYTQESAVEVERAASAKATVALNHLDSVQ